MLQEIMPFIFNDKNKVNERKKNEIKYCKIKVVGKL